MQGRRRRTQFIGRLDGGDIEQHLKVAKFTPWGRDPLTLGSYASALPGHYPARADIGRPLGDRLFFAGEACAGGFAATCGGAYRSGVDTAEAIIHRLG